MNGAGATEVFRYLRAVRAATGPATAAERLTAACVALHTAGGACWLSRDELAEETRLGLQTVRRALRALKAAGWLAEEHGQGKPRWSITVPDAPSNTSETARSKRSRTPPKADQRRDGWEINGAMAGRSTAAGVSVPEEINGGRGEEINGAMAGRSTAAGVLLSGSPPKTPPAETPPKKDQDPDRSQHPIVGEPNPQLGLLGIDAKPPMPSDPLQAPEVTDVLEHWRSRGYHTRTPIAGGKAGQERRKRIADRLAEGLTPDTLKAAIDGASLDDWLMGRDARSPRAYTGIETILRDAGQVERLARVWDVALAEGRVLPDGGDRHTDRFGNPRPRPPKPTADELAEQANGRQMLADHQRAAKERREQAAAPPAPAVTLDAEDAAEDAELRRVAERARARLAGDGRSAEIH